VELVALGKLLGVVTEEFPDVACAYGLSIALYTGYQAVTGVYSLYPLDIVR